MFEAYKTTDPEYAAILDQFAGHEVPEDTGAQLPAEDRWLAVLAALLGCQEVDAFRAVLPQALDTLSPVQVKEVSSIRPPITWASAVCCFLSMW